MSRSHITISPAGMNDTAHCPDLDSPYTLQRAQIDAFPCDGWIKLRQVFSPATLAHFGREITRLTPEVYPRSRPLEERSTYDGAFLQLMNLWERSARVARFVRGHQYDSPLAIDRTVTAWIPLQAVPAEMGPLGFYACRQGVAFGRDLGISDEIGAKVGPFEGWLLTPMCTYKLT